MCVIWGVPYLLIRVAVRELTPVTLVFARTSIAALLLLPIAAARGQIREVGRRWLPLVVFAAIEIGLPWLLLSSAEQHLTSSLSALLIAAVPLVGAAIAAVTGDDDRLSGQRLTGLLVGIGGVAAIVGLNVGASSTAALVEIGGVVIAYAVGPIVLSRYLSDLPGLGVVATALALCAIAYAPVALLERPSSVPSGRVLASVAVLAVVCTAIGIVVFFALIAEVGPVRSMVITYVNPAVAAVLGVTLLSEPFTVGMGIGFVLVLLGSILATRRSPTPRAVAEP